MTHDTRLVTGGEHCVIISGPLIALLVWDLWYFEGLDENDRTLHQSVSQ